MRETLADSIGSSLVYENMREGFDLDWYGEYSFNAAGIAETFGPRVVGILPVISDLEKLLDGKIFETDPTILAAGVVFLLAWAFFAGGIIQRYAHFETPYSRGDFFSTSSRYFFRFLRLLGISLILYWAIARWVGKPLHDWIGRATRDVTVERTVILLTVLVYLLVGLLLLLASLALDYAKIAMVVEKRSSAILAFVRGLRFVYSNAVRTLGLYLVLILVGLVLWICYWVLAPGPSQSLRSTLMLAWIFGQAFILARLFLKLWFLASQTAFFRSRQKAEEPVSLPSPAPEPAGDSAGASP